MSSCRPLACRRCRIWNPGARLPIVPGNGVYTPASGFSWEWPPPSPEPYPQHTIAFCPRPASFFFIASKQLSTTFRLSLSVCNLKWSFDSPPSRLASVQRSRVAVRRSANDLETLALDPYFLAAKIAAGASSPWTACLLLASSWLGTASGHSH